MFTPVLFALLVSSSLQRPAAPTLPEGGATKELGAFVSIPGVRELGGRLIARPLPTSKLLGAGATLEGARVRRAVALDALRAYRVREHVPQTDEYVVELARPGDEERAAAGLSASGAFEYVVPDWRVFPCHTPSRVPSHKPTFPVLPERCPDDPSYSAQWHLVSARLDACAAWWYETGAPSVAIGLCDTGVRATHQDLLLHRLEGYNAVDRLWESQGGAISAVMNHGTRTTGIAAANGDNGVGITGIGWNLSHRMLRVSNASDGAAWLTDLQHAARTSIESGDRVVNVSYAGVDSASNPTTAEYIASIGGLLVWAAGNEARLMSATDRDADDLLVVGASDMIDGLATFSNFGTYVDLVAPGVNITTTDSSADSGYTSAASGTSFAAPIVAGACGLVWSARPELSTGDVERALKLGAQDVGPVNLDDTYGYGRADLLGALTTRLEAVPAARVAGFPTSGVGPLSVQFRDLSTGVPTSWLWDFGDGTTSNERNPLHTYTSSGAFDVTLTVGNGLGADTASTAAFVLVDVIPPIAEFTATPTTGLSPLSVSFTDQSTGGIATAWAWDFGDGTTSTLRNPTHVFTGSGSFTVGLTVSNAFGSDTISKYAYVTTDYVPPIAAFSGTPTSGNSPLLVQFTDQSTGGIATSWLWTFGDGGVSGVRNPSHTYTAAGTYTVGLTASNAYGSNTTYQVGYVTVGQGPTIVANFTATPLTGTAPLSVQFTDLSVGNAVSWEWDFGDDTTSTLRNPVHVYTSSGEYDVTLQVSNSAGTDSQLDRLQYIIVN